MTVAAAGFRPVPEGSPGASAAQAPEHCQAGSAGSVPAAARQASVGCQELGVCCTAGRLGLPGRAVTLATAEPGCQILQPRLEELHAAPDCIIALLQACGSQQEVEGG